MIVGAYDEVYMIRAVSSANGWYLKQNELKIPLLRSEKVTICNKVLLVDIKGSKETYLVIKASCPAQNTPMHKKTSHCIL